MFWGSNKHVLITHSFPQTLRVQVNLDPVTTAALARIEHKLDTIIDKENQIMATEAEVQLALQKIDDATTKTAANVQVIADLDQQISNEVDQLLAAAQAAGVSQAILDRITSIGAKAQASSDALDAQVPVLQAIAAKGVVNPVPVEPPPPVEVTPTT